MHTTRVLLPLFVFGLSAPHLLAEEAAKPVFQTALISSYDAAADKIVQLANAFTDEQMAWRPAEGVRSTREAILHVVAANFFLGSRLGTAIPEDVKPGEIEKFNGSKAELVALLQRSSEFVHQAVQAVPEDDLAEDMQFFGRTAPRMRYMLIIVEHAHEHLGQLIAYARSNDVTPPWSQEK